MDYISSYINYISMMNSLNSLNGLTSTDSGYGSVGRSSAGNGFSDVLRTAFQSQSAGDMDIIFEEAARTYGVSADLLRAIGKAESNYDASATSQAGAMGVMQLMPGTAQSLGVSDPYDARSNIMGGAKYISQLLSDYGGNVELALAAYNAGSGNVAKYGGVPPFEETQNYIQKILGYMGETLKAGQTVSGNESLSAQQGDTVSGSSAISKEAGLQMIELIKLQMQMQMYRMTSQNDDDMGGFV